MPKTGGRHREIYLDVLKKSLISPEVDGNGPMAFTNMCFFCMVFFHFHLSESGCSGVSAPSPGAKW